MSVTRTTETFVNKCRLCEEEWRAMLEVDIIDWYDGTSSLVSCKVIECPNCRKMSLIQRINKL